MLATSPTRTTLIADLAVLYGTDRECWSRFNLAILERAWLTATSHWS